MKKFIFVILLFCTAAIAQVPGIPVIISPGDSAVICPPYLFDWNDVPTATSYEIMISLNQSFSQLVVNQVLNESQYILPEGVISSYSYCYWRVRAINSYGNGQWTAVRRVKSGALASSPVLLIPANATVNVPVNSVFKWRKVTGATSYKFLISSQSSYDTIYLADTVYGGLILQYNTYYYWRVIGINSCGQGNSSMVWTFITISASRIINISSEIPAEYKLYNNYPNPFNPSTNIKYQITNNKFTTLKIFDVLGREVKSLVNEFQKAGIYEVSFDATDLTSGIYFYRLQSGDFTEVKRMVMIK